jgi:beta-phosphoglucomutase-like phosphatase (HAD superfamily)
VTCDTILLVQPTQQRAWRAGRFWWDWPHPSDAKVQQLRAVIFDLDALADIDCAGHRPAFNAAFAALGLDIEWSLARYRQLQVLTDERRRVAAELRKRGVATECDVLAELLVDEICATKSMILGETVLDADIAPRAGLVDLIAEAYGAGIGIGIVSSGGHTWVEPLVRQLVGDGVVSTIVTADDAPHANLYEIALAELGAGAHDSLAFAGSRASQRTATAAGLASVLIEDDSFSAPLRVADCQRVYDSWHEAHPKRTAA